MTRKSCGEKSCGKDAVVKILDMLFFIPSFLIFKKIEFGFGYRLL